MKQIGIDPKERRKLEDLLELLGSIKGRHTELVTVLVPAGQNINVITRQLESEKSTASNIKSKQTRKNVTDALVMIIRELKNYRKTPENGLAIFCGNISYKEGDSDIQIWIYEPPKPLNVKIYRCDQEFALEPLKEMVGVEEVYGLLAIDRQHASIGLLEGSSIKVLQKLSSGVPGKIKAGGQCLSSDTLVETKERKRRICDIKVGDKLKAFDMKSKRIIFTQCLNKWEAVKKDYMEITTSNKLFLTCSKDHTLFIKFIDDSEPEITEDLVESPAFSTLPGTILFNSDLKDELVVRVKNKKNFVNLVDIETKAGNFFANNLLVHNSSQRFHRIIEGLAKEFFRRVADEMKKIFFDMPKLKGLLVGGPIPTKEEFLEEGNMVTKLREKVIAVKDIGYVDEHGLELLVEESQGEIAQQELIREKKFVQRFFDTLGRNSKMAVYGEEKVKLALERGAVEVLLMSKNWNRDREKELEKMAENISAEVVIISQEHTDGEQFFNLTKGAGALLRFALE